MADAPLAVAAAHIMGIVGCQIISVGRRQVCILFFIYCHIEIPRSRAGLPFMPQVRKCSWSWSVSYPKAS